MQPTSSRSYAPSSSASWTRAADAPSTSSRSQRPRRSPDRPRPRMWRAAGRGHHERTGAFKPARPVSITEGNRLADPRGGDGATSPRPGGRPAHRCAGGAAANSARSGRPAPRASRRRPSAEPGASSTNTSRTPDESSLRRAGDPPIVRSVQQSPLARRPAGGQHAERKAGRRPWGGPFLKGEGPLRSKARRAASPNTPPRSVNRRSPAGGGRRGCSRA
jgi:hypothetical protein